MAKKLTLRSKYFKEKLERTRQSLRQKHLLELDGSGDQDIEWLMAIVTLFTARELELEEDEIFYKLPPGKHAVRSILGTESPLSTEQD